MDKGRQRRSAKILQGSVMALKALWVVVFFLLPSLSEAQQKNENTYLISIRQELARLSLGATCQDSDDSCVFTYALKNSDKEIFVHVRFSRATNTVYLYVDRFLELEDPGGPVSALSRRLLDLNRQMVSAKFEWDKATNTIRLSASLNTDSNFDRKAFRSQVLGLLVNVSSLWPELKEFTER